MKTNDFEGYVASNRGLRKGAMMSGEEYRRDNRDREVEFPNKKRNEIERRPKRKTAKKVAQKEEVEIDGDDVFVSTSSAQMLTDQQELRLMANETVRRFAEKKIAQEAQENYDIILDCTLIDKSDFEEEQD